jgi:2-amino-4-hydroxy-6-hydroxymethyldihydropteridine diphosphokinase
VTYAFLALGSNVGPRAKNLQSAVKELSHHFSVVLASPVYQTKPMYERNQPVFLNAVVKIHTLKSLTECEEGIKAAEKALGKTKSTKNGPRNIDIDLLFYGDVQASEAGFVVPHPKIQERAFVLAPLKDIAPNFIHPYFKKSVLLLWNELLEKEKQTVKKMDEKLYPITAYIEPIANVSSAEEIISAVGVDDAYAVKTMAQKTIIKVIRLKTIRPAMANILKQEMLSLGADAAVHKDCVSCKIEFTDVLLIGTLKQLRQLISKLRVQVAEAQEIAFAVDDALRHGE